MGPAFDCPAGHGVLPALPLSDMSTGSLAAVTIMCAVQDRAKRGGSDHGHVSVTAYDMATLDAEIGLYNREVVRRIQEKWAIAS